MRRFVRNAPFAWLLLLLVLPSIAWLAGVRQPLIGNTPKAEFPAASVRALGHKETFDQIDTTLLDRIPFRDRAVELRGRIGVQVFGDGTHPDVHLGDDGWLFYLPELATCDVVQMQQAPDALEIMAGAIIASGRNAAIAVAGSKMIAERDLLGDEPPGLDCVAALEAPVHDRLGRTRGGVDIQGALDRQQRLGRHVFLPYDTHWNAIGRLTFATEILNAIKPGLAEQAGLGLAPTDVEEQSDLGRFLGIPLENVFRPVRAERTPPSPGKVLMIGDSQLEAAFFGPSADGITVGQRVLPEQPRCNVLTFSRGDCDDALRGAQHVVIETVARDLPVLVDTCWRAVSLAGENIRGAAGRWQTLDPAVARGTHNLRMTAAAAPMAITLPSGPVSRHARLVRIPLRELPPHPAGSPQAAAIGIDPASGVHPPCVTPQQPVVGGALFIPLPPGAKADELRFTVTAPAGTLLGAPEEIVLDGKPAVR